MRRNTPLSAYNRASAMWKKPDERYVGLLADPEPFNGLVMAAVNELQLLYLFTKLSGATDGQY